MSLYQTSSPSH